MSQHFDWSILPGCALVKIFYLISLEDRKNASLVCKHWSQCFYHPKLWNHYTIKCGANFETRKLHCFLKNVGTIVKSVEISCEIHKDSTTQACEVMTELSNVKHKQLKTFKLHNLSFGNYGVHVEVKSFSRCLGRFFSQTDDFSCKYLTTVDLNDSGAPVNDKLVINLAENHPGLQVLRIQGKLHFEKVPAPSSLLVLVQRCQSLKELDVYYNSIDNNVIKALCNCRKSALQKLSLICTLPIENESYVEEHLWNNFVRANKNVEAKVVVFTHRCRYLSTIVKDTCNILCPSLPVVHLELDAEEGSAELDHVTKIYSCNLRYLVIIGSFDAERSFERALLCLVIKCKQLKELHCERYLEQNIIDEVLSERLFDDHTLSRKDHLLFDYDE